MTSVRDAIRAAIMRRSLRMKGRVRRILRAGPDSDTLTEYDLMTSQNAAATVVYRAGRFWSDINADFRDLIWAGALRNLRNEYFNRRFSGPDPCSWQVYGSLLWIYRNRLLEMDAEFVSGMSDPAAGGTADQLLIDGRPISLDLLQSIEEGLTIRAALRQIGADQGPKIIVELGAGYGRLANVCRHLWPDCTYVILDLPEALICSQTWLNQVFPGDVVNYSKSRDAELNRSRLLSRRIWCLGPNDIERIPDGACDVFANIYSFAEMPAEAIRNYYEQLQRITKGVFYTKQRRREDNLADAVVVAEGSYPKLDNARELMRRTSTLYEGMFEAAYSLGEGH